MKFLEVLKAHWNSWTIKLGVIAGILVTVASYMPQVQSIVHLVWPAGDAYLVVLAMWIGRIIGFIKQVQATATPDATDQAGA